MSILELETMRRRARTDRNHVAIVAELRAVGCSVLPTHQLGGDAPDLIVGFQGVTALVEVKPPGPVTHKARVARQTDALQAWAGGPAFVATSAEDVLQRLRGTP